MAREYEFKAVLHFSFANHAEHTSMRGAAQSFASSNSGTAEIITHEDPDPDAEIPYYGKLTLVIPVASRAEAATMMGTIDAQLPSLPDLVLVNGHKLKYTFDEEEI